MRTGEATSEELMKEKTALIRHSLIIQVSADAAVEEFQT